VASEYHTLMNRNDDLGLGKDPTTLDDLFFDDILQNVQVISSGISMEVCRPGPSRIGAKTPEIQNAKIGKRLYIMRNAQKISYSFSRNINVLLRIKWKYTELFDSNWHC